MVSTLKGICMIIAVSALGSVLLYWFNPSLKDEIPKPEELLEGEVLLKDVLQWNEDILWVDARGYFDYEKGHIPNAIMLNEDEWDLLLPNFLDLWIPDQKVVVYCSSLQCHASSEVAQRMRDELGLDNIYVLKGGWESWKKENSVEEL